MLEYNGVGIKSLGGVPIYVLRPRGGYRVNQGGYRGVNSGKNQRQHGVEWEFRTGIPCYSMG